jgi:xanthine dehydrogenase accessory factor
VIQGEVIYQLLLDALKKGEACALATIAKVTGSTPRDVGAKMLIYQDGRSAGTIGGGKFESLVVAEATRAISDGKSILKTYPLHEASENSFGAICGGEVTVLIEPQPRPPLFCLVGAGHCSQALAKLANECGFAVAVLDDREELLAPVYFPSPVLCLSNPAPEEFIKSCRWSQRDALVLVSRNYHIDREALAAALETGGMGYIGMIGSKKKVMQVFDELAARGFSREALTEVRAPIGIDIGADSPAEIAVSVMAEVFMVSRGTSGRPLRASLLRSSRKEKILSRNAAYTD